MSFKKMILVAGIFATTLFTLSTAFTEDNTEYWIKVRAKDKFERTVIANTGVAIEVVGDDYVIVIGDAADKARLEKMGVVEISFPNDGGTRDFPAKDAAYHNYQEMTEKLRTLTNNHPQISRMVSIGKSVEGRDIWNIKISGNLNQSETLPGIVFMGGHHAREHLSVELPIRYVEYLLTEYEKGNPRIQRLVNSRDINFIPSVNPDGSEFDISTGKYKSWRKNRSVNPDGTMGVDLNRNYAFGWGGQGASKNPASETYRGPSPFSEPESQAIKKFVETNENIVILLSFHTFSELILYPYGHIHDSIADAKDRQVHEVMAKKMSQWNGYFPQQSADLYLAAGDTTDWAYGEHKIIAFTFELDPKDPWSGGGFYPGASVIDSVQKKNLEPVLYLIEYSDNPYRSLDNRPSDTLYRY